MGGVGGGVWWRRGVACRAAAAAHARAHTYVPPRPPAPPPQPKPGAPLSSQEARGTLFGALNPEGGLTPGKEGAKGGGGPMQQQQQQQMGQLPLMYAAAGAPGAYAVVPGAAPFMMPPAAYGAAGAPPAHDANGAKDGA